MNDTIDDGSTSGNDAFWGSIMARVGGAVANRVVGSIDPPKVDQSPVPTTNVIQIPPAFKLSVGNPLVIAGLVLGAFLLYRATK